MDILENIEDVINEAMKNNIKTRKIGDYLNGYVDACEFILNYCEELRIRLNNG